MLRIGTLWMAIVNHWEGPEMPATADSHRINRLYLMSITCVLVRCSPSNTIKMTLVNRVVNVKFMWMSIKNIKTQNVCVRTTNVPHTNFSCDKNLMVLDSYAKMNEKYSVWGFYQVSAWMLVFHKNVNKNASCGIYTSAANNRRRRNVFFCVCARTMEAAMSAKKNNIKQHKRSNDKDREN